MSNYFCNFLNKNRVETYGLGEVEISSKVSEKVQPANFYRTDKGFQVVEESINLEGELLDIIGDFSHEKLGCSKESLISTDENPIIMVATRGFKVYADIPTYLKYIPVRGGVLVALIKGVIGVVDDRGEIINLNRNQDVLGSDNGCLFMEDDIRNLNLLKDKESEVVFSDYVVNDVIISLTYSKDGSKMQTCKFTKENFIVLNESVFEEGRIRKSEREKAELERKRKLEEDIARHNELARLKAKQEAENKKEKVVKRIPKVEIFEDDYEEDYGSDEIGTEFDGAKGFLNFVEGLKSGA